MTASVAGAMFLVLVGVTFLCAALVGWWRVGEDPAARSHRLAGALVDLFIGLAALGDGAVSVIDEPERLIVFSAGSVALVLAVTVLVLHHRRQPQLRA